MKKKVVAAVLSLTMCMSMVVQAGASALSDGVSDGVVGDVTVTEPFEPEEEFPEEPVTPEVPEENQDDSLEMPETDVTPEATVTPEITVTPEASITPEADSSMPQEDILSAGEESVEVPETDVMFQVQAGESKSGSVTVGPEYWIKVPEGWKLAKKGNKTAVGGESTEAEQPQADIQTLENVNEEVVSEGAEDVLPMETAEPMETEVSTEPIEVEDPAETEQDEQSMTGAGVGEGMDGTSTERAAEGRDVYTAADGLVQVTTQSVKGTHTGYYLFDQDGIMVTGRKTVQPGTPGYTLSKEGELYFTEDSTAALYKEYTGTPKTPVTSDLGQQKKNYWLYQNGKFRLYGKSGPNVSVESMNDKYKDTGYLSINGKYYCLKDDGTPRTGFIGINGSKYFFDSDSKIPGEMFMGGWRCMGTNSKGEKWIYFNRSNKGKDKGKAVIHKGNVAITVTPKSSSVKYLLDHNGYILKNRRTNCVDGAWYGSDSQGRIVKDKLVRYGNYRYYFTKNGKQVGWKNMWKQCPTSVGPKYYYFGSTAGRVSEKKGWQKVKWPSGKFLGWFYFRDNGDHYMGRWVGNQYFDEIGKLASGIKTIDGKTYFFEISDSNTHRGKVFKNTMIKYNNKWYYAESDGQLSNNEWRKINGKWYYFKNFVSQTNIFVWKDGTYGWLDEQGKFCTGWVVLSNSENKVRYVDPKGNGFYKDTSAVIDGLRYYFDEKAYRINDLTSVYRGPYYVEVDRTNGVMTIYDQSRTVPVKSIRVSVGKPETPTPTGTFVLRRSGRWQSLMGPSWGQYGTHVQGAGLGGIFIHSVSGAQMNPYSVPAAEYNKLGNPASHGCIRACVADAKWVYENCNGATIRITDKNYESREALKGPLGRRARVPMRPPYNFDPTDPSI